MIDFISIKNLIEKYSSNSIIYYCIYLLNSVQKNDDKSAAYWQLLILIKWAYLYCSETTEKAISFNEIGQILKHIETLEKQNNLLNFKDQNSILRSLSIVAYQQFPLQDRVHKGIFSRQILLYNILKGQYDILDDFKKITGIELLNFINYQYITFLQLNIDRFDKKHSYDGIINDDFKEIFSTKFSTEEFNKYMALLSIKSVKEVKLLHKMKDASYQLYETTFLSTKPFLYFNNKYLTPHRSVFNHSVNYFIYDFMKINSEQFTTEFGERMEKYVELGLKEMNVSYTKGKTLEKSFLKEKNCDFLVDSHILIEVKAIELTPRSGILRSEEILIRDLRKNIIKAYIQLLNTANNVGKSQQQWYGAIITYKDMLLGFGIDAWEEFMKKEIEQYLSEKHIDLQILPPENLFFIDIDSWDKMVQVVKNKEASIIDIFLKAKEVNLKPETRVFSFEMVLDNYYKIKKLDLSYLEEAQRLVDVIP